jgi:hypothetical protein
MSKIAFLHNALGKTDGVSLEVDKWRTVLEKLGHEVFYIAGNDDNERVLCIPELSFYHKQTKKEIENATVRLVDYKNGIELISDINNSAKIIKEKLYQIIKENNIEIIIPNNLMSVGYHIAALKAIYEFIIETNIKTICHNHDFYFEDSGEVEPTCIEVADILEKLAPPNIKNVKNLVINSIAQKALFDKKHIKADIVPNVFDFEMNKWSVDDYNKTFLKDFNIAENDIIFLQATRVMDRKGIELAIDVVDSLNENKSKLIGKKLYNGKYINENSKIILLCAGIVESFGISSDYVNKLIKKAETKKVDIRFIGDRVAHSRNMVNGKKIYSLWDSYVYSDFVTYPSIWEGFGNQFIEAVFAKLPIIAFEYPVYISDLKNRGFKIVSLGDEFSRDTDNLVCVKEDILSKVSKEVISILLNSDLETNIVEDNYNIARKNYSYNSLEKLIESLNL